MRRSRSAALASPWLMMKLACFSDTEAPPMRKPLRPAASMRRAAWSPGGLVNTEPQLHSPIGCEARRRSRSSRTSLSCAAGVDGRDGEHVPPGFPAEGAGVHRERASERARDAREEFRGPEPPLDALPRDARTGDARLGAHRALAGAVEEIERAVRAHDHALQAAVAHQEVAPEPDPVDGHRGRERAQELCELDAIARIEENLGRAPDVPGGVPAQGLIAAHPLAELRGDGEAHRELLGGRSAASAPGSACATALMLPAPMARMTSPSEITSLSAAASSSTFSTNSGSSTPRLRTARQMARPSAPAIGASPAAYTSVTARASAPESTLPKSSIRSRVRV